MTENIKETQCSSDGGDSSIISNAPENTIDVVNKDETMTIRERLLMRKKTNRINHRLIESEDEEKKDIILRYKLQKYNNGGQEYNEETNEVKFSDDDGPSQYEKNRYKKIDADRTKRIEDQRKKLEDRKKSLDRLPSYERDMDRYGTLDDQIDEFLYEYVQEYGSLGGDD